MSVSKFLLVMLGAAAGGLVIFIAFICVYLWHARFFVISGERADLVPENALL